MSLADRLNYFKKETYQICKAIDEVELNFLNIIKEKFVFLKCYLSYYSQYGHESSFDRTRREIQHKLAESEKYRASVLRNVATFGKQLIHLNIFSSLNLF